MELNIFKYEKYNKEKANGVSKAPIKHYLYLFIVEVY